MDKKIAPAERDRAVDELIELVAAVDGILQAQSRADVEYFLENSASSLGKEEIQRVKDGVLKAYRWQYIFSVVEHRVTGRRWETSLRNLKVTASPTLLERYRSPLDIVSGNP